MKIKPRSKWGKKKKKPGVTGIAEHKREVRV